jgi:hypothetical protein
MSPAIIILIAIAVVAAIGFSIYSNYKRKKDLMAWAAANGLSYTDSRDGGFEDRYPNFSCLRQGSNRYAHNIMRGQWQGRDIEAFDYHYETHSTNSKGHRQTHHHHFSCVVLTSDVPLKPLMIRPEGFFDKITEFVGFDDIDFESAEFSRKFFVKAPDRRWAFDVIHTRMMEFLLAHPGNYIEFDTNCVLAWRKRRFSPVEYTAAADLINGMYERFPDYLLEQLSKQV